MIDLLLAMAMTVQAPAPIPAPTPPDAAAPLSSNLAAELDRLLQAKDYKPLGEKIASISTMDEAKPALDWLQAKMMEGNSAFITMLYSRLLWNYAALLPDKDAKGQKQTSAMTMLYALAAISIDGKRCGDVSGPGHRLEQLVTLETDIPLFFMTLSGEEAQQLVDMAIALETTTNERRTRLATSISYAGAVTYNLEHGSSREIPSQPGAVGRTVELSGDGNYRPSEKPEAEWRAVAEQERAAMPTTLREFVESLRR